jgi:cation:H+ antiporter
MGPVGAALAILGGLVLLVAGGELLVRGAVAIAAAARLSPLVIGLTVVAFGTSAPELAVGLRSALTGQADLVVGNVIGSNIFNVLFILGASALITPLVVSSQLIRFDVPLMIVASLALLGLGLDGLLGRADASVLFAGLLGYLFWTFRQARNDTSTLDGVFGTDAIDQRPALLRAVLGGLLLVSIGLGLLTFGSHWLVVGSVALARLAGVSELIIGLTIVAVGTSLPEVATSILAAVRGQRDIAVGNIVGSNLFNILGILGLSGILAPEPIAISAAALRFDIPVMIAVALACLPIFFTGRQIARWEGALFLGYYVTYVALLILQALGNDAARTLGLVMILFVIPLTCVTLIVTVVRDRRNTQQRV